MANVAVTAAARCPACAVGQGQSGSDSLVWVGALALVPLLVALIVGVAIVRLLRERRE